MAEALKLGAPLVEKDSGFPGFIKPRAVGGSAEAGIGYFLGSLVTTEQNRFELLHGIPPTSGQSIDDRFEQLANWYRLRSAVMASRYKVAGCIDLF